MIGPPKPCVNPRRKQAHNPWSDLRCFFVAPLFGSLQVFLVRKVTPPDDNQLYAMKVLRKATLKGEAPCDVCQVQESRSAAHLASDRLLGGSVEMIIWCNPVCISFCKAAPLWAPSSRRINSRSFLSCGDFVFSFQVAVPSASCKRVCAFPVTRRTIKWKFASIMRPPHLAAVYCFLFFNSFHTLSW